MRIGLYGLPCSGKSTILGKVDFMKTLKGSELLHEIEPDFEKMPEEDKLQARKNLALRLREKKDFLMDGHFSFGDKDVFTEDDGNLYDVFLYLYISPKVLMSRMSVSKKNEKYLAYDIAYWQDDEIEKLRTYCHLHNKDFFVLDNPKQNYFDELYCILNFIRAVKDGFSCVHFARNCADSILKRDMCETILLTDGDRTVTKQDSSHAVFQYTTHIFDGNFYTGYQAWKQSFDFEKVKPSLTEMPVDFNDKILEKLNDHTYILTSGHPLVWSYIAEKVGLPFFSGAEMSADTKYFVTKFLRDAGCRVVAFGDSLNDYYMLKEANEGYLIAKSDGSLSRSLSKKDLGGINIVYS